MKGLKPTLVTAVAIGLLAGSTVGVVAQEEPVEVTGEVTFPDSSTEIWETNDPRLTGTGRWAPTEGFPLDQAPSYWVNGRFLETDEGTWRQLPVPSAVIAGAETDPYFDMVLIGEGGYEGLVFIAQAAWVPASCPPGCDGFEVHGYIVEAAGS